MALGEFICMRCRSTRRIGQTCCQPSTISVSDGIGVGHSVVDVQYVTAAVSRAKRQDATEEKKEYEACPFAGIIQIKFNGISQIESCQSNPRTPVMLHTKTLSLTCPGPPICLQRSAHCDSQCLSRSNLSLRGANIVRNIRAVVHLLEIAKPVVPGLAPPFL